MLGDKALFNGGGRQRQARGPPTNRTTGGTQEIYAGNNPYALTTFGNVEAVFDGINPVTHTRRLWVTDGTSAGTHPLVGVSALRPYNLTVFGNELLFNGYNANTGQTGLWETDGTVAGLPRDCRERRESKRGQALRHHGFRR